MKDINVISNNYAQGSYQLLRESFDRARASVYFADLCSKESNNKNENKSRWYYRASLSEFKSIFDVLPTDFKNIGLAKIWKRSEFKNTLDSNVLITVLSKARDLAIHSASLKGNHKNIVWQYMNENEPIPIEHYSLFFNEINREMLNDKASYITQEQLNWFNKQSKEWPAYLLVREAIYQSSYPVANFLTVNHKYISV